MSPELRQQVRERAAGRCEYCHLPETLELTGPFHVEHVIARQHRGTDESSNLAWACSRCNRHKGTNLSTVDPDSDEVVSLFNPRRERWGSILKSSAQLSVAGIRPAGQPRGCCK